MQTEKGNLARVLVDSARYAAQLRECEERMGPREAEIVPGATPHWHVLVTYPFSERVAAGHLIGRRFGVYLPMLTEVVRGRKRAREMPLFPGYLFLFVWDVARHWDRVRACAGVVDVLRDANEHPAIVPDHLIDAIQAREIQLLLPYRSRRGRARRRDAAGGEGMLMTISTRSFLHNLAGLDDEARISLLHKALGLDLAARP